MKIYKTKPDKYGWYFVIHKNKDGTLKLMQKNINHLKEWRDVFDIWEKEDLELLKKVINEK
ncbi:hypothetical protein LCGC14_0556460 [marine sediment metagenome]|uniref:Uncharacterized protein n=1 Tax=marine sediment metagenome TaxID=412755 RepID=A0A0F9UWI0_9ZZZZ